MKKITNRVLSNSNTLEPFVNVGFIQTIIDKDIAWGRSPNPFKMSSVTEQIVWSQIKKGFCNLKDHESRPDLIVMPELTLPLGYMNHLKDLSQAIGSVVIAGMDFERVKTNGIRNRAVLIVPQYWPENKRSRRSSCHFWGKAFFSQEEKDLILRNGSKPDSDHTIYMFDAGRFGRIGVALCSDIFDIERFLVYKGRIHHLIVIAHNKDINSFYFLAEAISRLVFCNVVICNTGYFGDSLAFSPREKDYKRVIYRHKGQQLFSTQVVRLPVFDLDEAQKGNDQNTEFKGRPPGYKKHEE